MAAVLSATSTMRLMLVHLVIIAWLGVDGRSLQVSPTPLLRIVDPSAAATLEEETIANASTSLSNTSLADLQTDNVTQRLQLRYRERKKQERLLLIQTQILQRLGISRQPNITSPHISDDERSRMTQLFERMRHMRSHGHINDIKRPLRLNAERMQSFYPSCSLPNNTDRDIWDNPETFRIFYDITVPRALVDTEISIVSAKLRLYKMNDLNVDPECANWEQNVSALPRYNMLDALMHSSATCGLSVSVYQYTKPVRTNKRERKRFIDSHTVPADYHGWVEFNVITSLNQWIENKHKNYGFNVEVEDAFGNKLNPSHYFRNANCSDDYVTQDPPFPNILEIHPEMAENESSLFDNETYPTLDLQTVELSREQPTVQTVESIERILKKRHANYNENCSRCRKEQHYITFKELDIDGVIIKPDGFNYAFCSGNGSYEEHNPESTKIQCMPKSFKSINITYVDQNGDPKDTVLHNIVASECWCRGT